MDINGKLNITVTVEGIQLPMTVSSTGEEIVYRDAASLIQNRLRKLRDTYPTLPSEKYYYAMAMLNTAVENVRAQDRLDTEPFMDMINDLNKELDKVIKK